VKRQPTVGLARRQCSSRIGLLGGTFDPIHNGHIELAEAALRLAALDVVYFVTSFDPPHKDRKSLANFADRHAMVALAVINKPQLVPSSMEYSRSGKSYAVDTVRQLKQDLGTTSRIFFLIGIDAFVEITGWKEHSAFPELCSFIIFSRPGFPQSALVEKLPDSFRKKLVPISKESKFLGCDQNCFYLVENFSSSISSTEVRNEVHSGKSITAWVPSAVAEYIQKTKLYSDDGRS
jgi:nicotinate-nucleotide adenylyltransferase